MQKELFSIIVLSFSITRVFSQTLIENNFIATEKTAVEADVNNLCIESKDDNNVEKDKLQYPYKSSPEIFFIVDDKPVSREEYLKHKEKKQ